MTALVDAIAPARLGRPFRWLLASSWTSNLGDGLAVSAAPLLVAADTGDPSLVALSVVLQRLPWLLFGLFAGVVADRFDRRRTVVGVNVLRAVVLVLLSGSIVARRVDIFVVLAVLFVLGTAETFADTTSTTLLPMVVDRDDLPIGNARLKAGFVTVNQLIGPPAGAALFAAAPVAAFAVQGACMALSAAMTARLVLPAHGRAHLPTRSHLRRDVADGLRWLWDHPAVRTLAVTIVTFNVTYGAAWSVLVLYATDRLGMGEIGFGALTTATAVGGLLGTVTYGWLTARVSLGNLMRLGLIIETLTHLALALPTSGAVALAIMFVFGAHAFVWGTTATSVRQRAVPSVLQGRVTSVYMIGLQGGLVVGGLIGGPIADAWGLAAPFWFAFSGCVVLVVAIWRQLSLIAHADDAGAPPAAGAAAPAD